MTWPQDNSRIVVHGRVDPGGIGNTNAWITVDESTSINGTLPALIRVPLPSLTPESTAHVMLRESWRNGFARERVLIAATLIRDSGACCVLQFETCDELHHRRIVVPRENLIYGEVRGGKTV